MSEKKLDLGLLTERRKFFEEMLQNSSLLVHKFLIGSVKDDHKKPINDQEAVSKFAFNFAVEPETRHEAHWQFQSFVLLEVLAEMRENNELLAELTTLLKDTPRPAKKKGK